MNKIALAFPAFVAAALAVSGCAKSADSINVTELNETTINASEGADVNLGDADALDANSEAPANAL